MALVVIQTRLPKNLTKYSTLASKQEYQILFLTFPLCLCLSLFANVQPEIISQNGFLLQMHATQLSVLLISHLWRHFFLHCGFTLHDLYQIYYILLLVHKTFIAA